MQELVINNPFQGVWNEAGAGGGKSSSIVEPVHFQAFQKGMACYIYDYKGSPPTLGLTAYNYWLDNGKKGNFNLLNFSAPWLSKKVNPIHINNLHNNLVIGEYANALMKNLEKTWISKTDFWANNAINFTQAAIMYLKLKHPEFCDLPHAISFILTDYEVTLEALASCEEIKPLIQPIIVAHEKNAEGQLTGVISSVQLPTSKLFNKELYFSLSPTKEDYDNDNVVDLDISNEENPTSLIVCNDPNLETALSPVISVITSVVMKNINQKGKIPCLFSIDELPTIYIMNLSQLPATARANKVVTFLSVQDYSQLAKDYGDKEAKTIISNMGNQFIGLTNNADTAKRISDMLGKVKKVDISYSTSSSSNSTSEKLQLESVREMRDIAGQPIGHFTGKIAGGEPPFFSAQFEDFEGNYLQGKTAGLKPLPINIPKGYPFDKKNVNMETLKLYYNDLMVENFDRINQNVKDILQPFREVVESKRK
ncbi:MAG: type IV secretory system conjugative DNA transfer family protein [Saprospiraceae bacterium]